MDIEELSTTQIILLALLVSFVTSIATGIVTVSLLAQAPPAVTNTVNQVVERTIETIVPADSGGKTTTVKETTVVVKEDDLITASIAQSFGKTGRVHQNTASTSPVSGLAAEIGNGLILTDASLVDKDHLVSFSNGEAVFSVVQKFPTLGVAVLGPKDASSTPPGAPYRVGDANALKLGQTVIALVSVTSERVSIGAVASKSALADVGKENKVSVRTIDTNITADIIPGTPLMNIFGDLVGVYTGASALNGRGSFVAASDIGAILSAQGAVQGTSTAAVQ